MVATAKCHGTCLVLIAIVCVSPVLADEPAELILGTDRPVSELVSGLPWELEVIVATPADEASLALVPECVGSRVVRLRSVQPLSDSAAGPMFLELTLTSLSFEAPSEARTAYASALYGADPDTGLSYAWDLLIASDSQLHLLHAPCLLSSSHWEAVAEAFTTMLGSISEELAIARCSCGGGCRSAS